MSGRRSVLFAIAMTAILVSSCGGTDVSRASTAENSLNESVLAALRNSTLKVVSVERSVDMACGKGGSPSDKEWIMSAVVTVDAPGDKVASALHPTLITKGLSDGRWRVQERSDGNLGWHGDVVASGPAISTVGLIYGVDVSQGEPSSTWSRHC